MADKLHDFNARNDSEQPLRYASDFHAPVLCNAVLEGLITSSDGVYLDGTLGGGGHAAALLGRLASSGRVIGIDLDADAIRIASERLKEDMLNGRFMAIRGNYSEMITLLAGKGIDSVDGILLDLGVSSRQLDEPARGFSHRFDGPLDMRMNPLSGITAFDIVNGWSEYELARTFRRYGEEPRAKIIARQVVSRRPLNTTDDLAEVVRRSVPQRQESKALARVFQSLRIAVNGELNSLEIALQAAVDLVRPRGRLAVISYHSLEDRRVKRFLRTGNFEGEVIRDLFGVRQCPWNDLTRKPIAPSQREQEANRRSRSARLRVAERAA